MSEQSEKLNSQRLLIISNNVLSETRNNGKTILSYFEKVPKECVYQLYFSKDMPTLEGYRYFQISDHDVVRGWISPKKRGRVVIAVEREKQKAEAFEADSIPKNSLSRLLREVVWFKHWLSPQLKEWLDSVNPTAVFFVGGDCMFAYDICKYIVDRYDARLSLYITDDYLIPGFHDGIIAKLRKTKLKHKVVDVLKKTSAFFTVSAPMREAYRQLLGRDSILAVNMPDRLQTEMPTPKDDTCTMIYAGSLYYGRDQILGRIADGIVKHNASIQEDTCRARLCIYSNWKPTDVGRAVFEREGSSMFCGSLSKVELEKRILQADILVFAESFDEEMVEKTRYSLSTKVPEYLSAAKPILAVGPKGIGSMEHLQDCALCVNKIEMIEQDVIRIITDVELRKQLSLAAEQKFERYHDKERQQAALISYVFGLDIG